MLSPSVSRTGGGVFEALLAQVALARALGHEPIAFGLDDEHVAADRVRFGDTEVVAQPVLGPRGVGFAPKLLDALVAADLDLLHLHGIWMYPSAAAARWARRTGRRYIVSPHGMLDPWIVSRGRVKKLIARIAYERASWAAATLFHALTEAEAADVRWQTGRDAVAIVPNATGVGAAPLPAADRERTILYLSRIHPKKNVAALVDGWSALARDGALDGHRLLICGWGDAGDIAKLEAQLRGSDPGAIAFLGPVFGEEKARLIASARYLVLPSLSEGLPMAILEAWAAGTPTIMTEGCHLPIGFATGAAIDCGVQVESIAAALRQALAAGDAEWSRRSDAARALAETRFAPALIARQWNDIYSDR